MVICSDVDTLDYMRQLPRYLRESGLYMPHFLSFEAPFPGTPKFIRLAASPEAPFLPDALLRDFDAYTLVVRPHEGTAEEYAHTYRELLRGVEGIQCLNDGAKVHANNAYFPILVGAAFALSRDELNERLRDNGVFARRYFYPLISEFPMYRGLPSSKPENLPVATAAAARVLCLPIYPALTDMHVRAICEVICDA